MVNSNTFSERLKHIMAYYNLSASAFADKIDVQRSSISHLISGRNKPSLDFVMKVLAIFKEVELYWLINGEGTFPKTEQDLEYASSLFNEALKPKKEPTPIKKRISTSILNDEIDKIVIFYKNGRFKKYEEL